MDFSGEMKLIEKRYISSSEKVWLRLVKISGLVLTILYYNEKLWEERADKSNPVIS